MGLVTALPDHLKEVDVIIVGGGTAGCVIASRLADSDAALAILVIEEGSSSLDNPSIRNLAYFWKNFVPTTGTMKFLVGNKSEHLAGRQIVVPTGRGLGGGSAVNMAIYSRAQRFDFDSWNVLGWSAQDMLPFMRKLETYHGPGPKERHGDDGPIQISGGTFRAKRAEDDFLNALRKAGWPEVEDANDLETCNGGQRALRYVSPDGARSDAAHAYLRPRLEDGKHPNLHVLVESSVVRIELSQGRATGVVYRPNAVEASEQTVQARKMIIIASGACGSPAVLERSGVGDPAVLKKAGVQTVVEIPGVGRGYQDHHLVGYPYRSSLQPEETFEMASTMDAEKIVNHEMRGWNGVDVSCKLRPTEEDVAALGQDFAKVWERDFKNINKPIAIMAAYNGFPGDPTGLPLGQYFSHSVFTVYPYSRGHIHITGPGLGDELDFETGFLADPGDIDVKKCRWAYKTQREIARRRAVYRGEVSRGHPPFPAGSAAACVELDESLGEDVANIGYTAEDDSIIDQWLRENVTTTWHSLGTCKMGPLEDHGVVDGHLSVHGVAGLKVADMSIASCNIGAHPNNTALTIGERAADIFIRELKGFAG